MAIDEKETLTGDAALAKIRRLLKDLPIAFMVTVDGGGVLARPIGVVGGHGAFDGSLWFITDRRSRKVAAIQQGATTALLFQNDREGTYLHLSGRAEVVEDRDRLKALYTPVQRTWFPDGVDDPHITLLRFDATDASYWDGHASMLRLATAFAKSLVTGAPGASGNAGIAELPAESREPD
ncbi:MAG TPA: pyridoxamine 5'-phosphate oxidase family protein [Vicinamibacterales bacterium]|nr:pyridoxamine 5'-phosphate oxidase family protein [Vicinamibacterales bacterium]